MVVVKSILIFLLMMCACLRAIDFEIFHHFWLPGVAFSPQGPMGELRGPERWLHSPAIIDGSGCAAGPRG